jgi:YkoY family integral membrane protein
MMEFWPFVALVAWYVLVLVFLEGLLSADNALVLALMVRHLPKPQQKRALRYGIWGAWGFRIVAVLLSAQLMNFWPFKLAGGAFLLFLSLRHFLSRSGNDSGSGHRSRFGSGFWATVISVELADIAFSIDSILAAVAMVDGLPREFGSWKLGIVITGGVLGVLTMRFVAGYFILLLDRFKGLEAGAYILVAWIGLKLILSGVNNATGLPTVIPELLFWGVMVAIVAVSLFYKPRAGPPEHKEEVDGLVEVANMLAGEEKPE